MWPPIWKPFILTMNVSTGAKKNHYWSIPICSLYSGNKIHGFTMGKVRKTTCCKYEIESVISMCLDFYIDLLSWFADYWNSFHYYSHEPLLCVLVNWKFYNIYKQVRTDERIWFDSTGWPKHNPIGPWMKASIIIPMGINLWG